ncbi:MAG: hypothetical protein P1U61_05295 [Legionellaceae bacterium]|nr:hypothetical protein [Legionellaceae bacterium]
MPANQTFFQQLKGHLSESQQERSRMATYLYNHYGEPHQKMMSSNAHWFSPSGRADFSAFRAYSGFSDDMTGLILKPYIFSTLAANEVQKFRLSFLAALTQVIKFSPTGFANKLVDMAEALIATFVLATLAAVETLLQVGSLVARLGLTAMSTVGFDVPVAKEAVVTSGADDEVNDSYDMAFV